VNTLIQFIDPLGLIMIGGGFNMSLVEQTLQRVSESNDADGNAAGSVARGIVGAAADKQFCTTRTVCFN
jgi:hypothetical protein